MKVYAGVNKKQICGYGGWGDKKFKFWGQNIQKQVYPPNLEAFKAKHKKVTPLNLAKFV